MKIYMISLKRDIERREQMQKKFPRYYPKFHIIDAVDAKDESSAEIIQKYDKPCPHDKRRPLTKGEKCCAISHLLALEDFLQSGDERCIIIEDDIFGNDRDFDEAIYLTQQTKSEDLVILGGQQGLKNSSYLFGYKLKDNFWSVSKLSSEFITRACCYAISRDAANIILQVQYACLTRSDFWAKYEKEIDIYYSNIFFHPVDLTNSNLEEFRKKSFLQKIYEDGMFYLFKRQLLKLKLKLFFLNTDLVRLPILKNKV